MNCKALKMFLYVLLILQGCFVANFAHSAEEAVVFGPVVAVSEKGAPNKYTHSFLNPAGFDAPYRLVVTNGGNGESQLTASASIYLNGTEVLSPSAFNQGVFEISREIDLSSANTLNIEMRSAPGAFLEIVVLGQKTSEVPNEVARAGLTASGGTKISVPSNAEALGGATIDIPPDAAIEDIEVQVGFESALPGVFRNEAIAFGVTQVSETLVLKVANGGPSTFNEPITITIPYNIEVANGLPPAVFYWDSDERKYRTASVISVDRENGTVTFQTSHFSSFVSVVLDTLNADMPDVDTGFAIGVDSILHKNFGSYQYGGHCAAFASMSSYYYSLRKNNRLYAFAQEGVFEQPVDDELTRTALTMTYGLLSSKWASVAKTNLVFLGEVDTGYLIAESMIVTGDPVHLVIYSNDKDDGAHSVTIYGYDKGNAAFRIYDSNFPKEEVTYGWNLLTGFGSYSKSQAYPFGFFDRIGYASDDTFGSPGQFNKIITSWEDGSLKDLFSNLTITDSQGATHSLDYGIQVDVKIPYQDKQTVSGKFIRPTGSSKQVYLHVYQDGKRKSAVAATIDASGEFELDFPVKLEDKVEIMLIVSEHPRSIESGFTAFGIFDVQPEGKNFFVNFGFETGDISGWASKTTLRNNGLEWTPTKTYVANVGFDPIAVDIPMVQFGMHAIRVNDSTNGYHTTYISQTAIVPESGNPSLQFQWAAVLEDPGHPPAYQPYVDVVVRNVTKGSVLYQKRFYTNDPTYQGWVNYQGGQWKAIPWQSVLLNGFSDSGGDTIELRITGADCGYGGHGGYVYLDGEE